MTKERFTQLVEDHGDMVLRLAYSYLHHIADSQDVSQMVFEKLYRKHPAFRDKEHEKAYILRMTANCCKNILKSSWRTRVCAITEQNGVVMPPVEEGSVLWAVNQLEKSYGVVIYLHYYEGYKGAEIAKILGVTTATVHTRLSRGRQQLKLILGGIDDEIL